MPLDALDQIEADAYGALRPPAKIALSEWTESNVVLPSTLAAAPGLMRLFPYQREMADAMGDPSIERVTVLKSARVGYTQLAVAALAHYAANDPAAVLCVLPTESDARHLMTGVIEPTFRESVPLAGLLEADARGRDTMLARHYPGGSLSLVSASSPRNLRARTARVLMMDELDGWEIDARGEGDPVLLAEKRTFTFSDRKIIAGSTPVDEDTSRIVRLYDQSDQRVWECPCPHCGSFHEIVWADIRWEPGRPETAAWACPSCGALTEDRDKATMLMRGRWRATRPEITGHAGFRINSLSSMLANASWPKLAAEFLQAKRSPVTLKPFVNTVLGEAWRSDGENLDPSILGRLQRPQSLEDIPDDVLFLTAGADVQGDRIEVMIAGWTGETECRVLGYEIIFGTPLEDATWKEVDSLLTRTWLHPRGGILRLDAAVIDSGNWADAVYAYTRPRSSRRFVAGKGIGGMNRPYVSWGASRKTKLALIGVDVIKLHLHERVKSGGTITFSDQLGQDVLDQISAERLITRYVHGHPIRHWEKTSGRRNEALDCLVYATAAKQLVPNAVDKRREDVFRSGCVAARAAIVKSNWLSRGDNFRRGEPSQ
jgi:phage terminase large subunit GpA-like protein